MKKLTTEEFIQKSINVHGDIYDYSKVVYVNNSTKVIIGCKEHSDFEQTPNSHLNGRGCYYCSKISSAKSQQTTTEEFISKANEVHGDRYYYSKVNYIGAHKKVIIICKEHGEFKQRPNDHLRGNRCPTCSGKKQLTTEEFIKNAVEVHGNKYDYSKVVYVTAHKKVIIICKEHGEFEQIANDHLNGSGCNKCSKRNYSQKAIAWLNQIAEKENIYIQHAEHEGEYQIPGTRYFADGYCKQNNTIYEFYGNRFHGNLNLFEEDELCHPYNNESAGSLYTKTTQREQEIKDLGYNIISIWENKFDNNV